MIKRLFLGLSVSALLAVSAYAGGLFDNYPIVGGSSFCAATTNGVCVTTVPAGPSALTGSEALIADTNLTQGQNPQTVQIPVTKFALAGTVQVITTNASLTIGDGVGYLISNQTTATVALVTLPANPSNGQIVRIVNAGSGVLTLTSIAANAGQSIVGGAAPATLGIQTNNSAAAVLSNVAYIYNSSNTSWYRIQ